MILMHIYCLNIYSNMTSFFHFGLERYAYILSLAPTRQQMLKFTRVCVMLLYNLISDISSFNWYTTLFLTLVVLIAI
jgi:hypothetical protein